MTRFVLIHASQRFDRAHTLTRDAVARYRGLGASVMTLTETDGGRWKVLETPTWDQHHVGDTAVTWDAGVWKWRHRSQVQWRGAYVNAQGKTWRYWGATIVVLQHQATGKLLVVAAVHTPATVEAGGRWTANHARLGAYRDLLRAVRDRCNQLAREYDADGLAIGLDGNASLRMAYVREWLASFAPRWRHGWEKRRPVRGTHAGRRVIDWVLVKRARHVGRPTVLKRHASSDHNAVRAVIEL